MEQIDNNEKKPVKKISLYDSAKFVRHNFGKIMTLIIYLIALSITFVALDIKGIFEIKSITYSAIILAFCSISLYCLRFADGKRDGKKQSEYIKIYTSFREVCEHFSTKAENDKLVLFCDTYNNTELENSKTYYLSEVGIDYNDYINCFLGKDYKSIKNSTSLSKRQKKVIYKCNKMKKLKLTSELLIGRNSKGRKRVLPIMHVGKGNEMYRKTAKILCVLVNVLMTASVSIGLASAPTFATFVWALFNLFPIVVSDVFGYSDGFYNITTSSAENLQSRIDILRQAKDI